MKYRTFCNTKVSEIGLGTWQLGADWGDVDDTTAEKVLATAVENGVNLNIVKQTYEHIKTLAAYDDLTDA